MAAEQVLEIVLGVRQTLWVTTIGVVLKEARERSGYSPLWFSRWRSTRSPGQRHSQLEGEVAAS